MDRGRTYSWRAAAVAAWFCTVSPVFAISAEDSRIEECLAKGKMLKGTETMEGVTRPFKVRLECEGETRNALFKSVDEHRRGITRLQGAGAEMNFSDDYRYERAAYLLDRELGLGMVPVAVIRTRRGDDGALIDWLENASHETEMPNPPTGRQMAELARQKKLMYLFDALIENTDRRPPNWMIGNDDWKLYLIDHSRAFRTNKRLPTQYLDQPTRLNRDLFQRLQELDEETLRDLMKSLLDGNQIGAILARRDAIIEKIEGDLVELGESAVFSD